MIRSRFSYLISRLHYPTRKSKQKQATEALCSLPLSSYVSVISFLLFFVFILLIVFFWNCFKLVHSFLIFFLSVVGAIYKRVGQVRPLLIETTVKL